MEQKMEQKIKKWLGTTPTTCDICNSRITNEFYDAHTIHGPWGLLCPSCFNSHGCGLGPGRGQRYIKASDENEFIKIGG